MVAAKNRLCYTASKFRRIHEYAPWDALVLCVTKQGLNFGRDDVSESASISSGIAARYATALFELAKESKGLKALEGDIDALDAALNGSADLKALIASPVYSREDQANAIAAIAAKMGLSR